MFDSEKIELLRVDIRRRARKLGLQGGAALRFFLREPQYRTLFWHRLAEAANNGFLRSCFHLIYLRSSRRSGLEILVPELGGGVIMPHWGRIILNAESIGNELYVFHNVTIGNDYRTGRPSIGSNVFIGAGSIVIGKIHIGDHVVVAAGSIVVRDVPPKTLVAGNPARVIKSLEPEETQSLIGY
jgi:serine O-acetyltransferase